MLFDWNKKGLTALRAIFDVLRGERRHDVEVGPPAALAQNQPPQQPAAHFEEEDPEVNPASRPGGAAISNATRATQSDDAGLQESRQRQRECVPNSGWRTRPLTVLTSFNRSEPNLV